MSTSFLYDAPGPVTRRRIRTVTGVSAVLVAGLLGAAAWQLGQHGQLAAERWTPFLDPAILRYLAVGLRGTLLAALVVGALSFPIGLLLAVGRTSPHALVRVPAAAFVEVFRTVPVLLLIFVMLFALPRYGFNPSVLWKLAIPLTVANAAVIAEIVRAGIVSLPRGQTEAGLSLGLRRLHVVTRIVLPQALRHVTPSLVSQVVSLLKDTSLGFVVAYTELLYRAQVLTSFNRLLIQTYVVVTLVYLCVNGALSWLASWLRARIDAPVAVAVGEVAPAVPTQSEAVEAGGHR